MVRALRGAYLQADEDADLPGDARAAWGERVARHNRSVELALVARGIPLDRAKDLAQSAWTRLWERQLEGGLVFVELPGLAIRQALLLESDERRRRERQQGLRVLAPPVLQLDPDAQILSRDQLRRVRTELEGLAPSARKVFGLWHSGEGLTHAEIALRTGLSVERVRHVLCEIRARLRGVLEDDAP